MFQALVEECGELIALLNDEGLFRYASPAAGRVLGWDPEALLERDLLSLAHPEDRDGLRELLSELAAHPGESRTGEHRWEHRDGRWRWIESCCTNLLHRPQVGGIVLLGREVTRRHELAERLAESEERFRSLFDANPDAVYSFDPDGRFLAANPACARISGYSLEEIHAMTWMPLIVPEDRERALAAFRRALAGEPADYEVAIRHREGRRVELRGTSFPMRAGGRVVGVYGVARDVTEQQRTAAALRASEARYRQIVDTANEGILTTDAAARLTYLNPRMAVLLGATAAELLGRSLFELIHPKDHPVADRCYRTLRQNRTMEHELRLLRPDGEVVWTLAACSPLQDADHAFCGTLQLLTDISERKRAEAERERLLARAQAAREEAEAVRERLALLAEASRVLASSLDYEETLDRISRLAIPRLADWCFVDVVEESGAIRRVAVSHTDGAREELAARLRLYPPEPESPHPVARVLRTGKPILVSRVAPKELRAIARNEEHERLLRALKIRSFLCVPLTARGRTLGAVCFVYAASGRRYTADDRTLAEELAHRAALALDNARLFQEVRRADANKDQFLALLGHELRNPLGPIRNAVAILERLELDDPRFRNALGVIRRQVAQEARLIEDLLNVSRIARGKLLLRFESVDFGELVRCSVEDYREAVAAAGLRLALDLPSRPVIVRGDPTRLAQVVGNLLSNAIKFTDPGGSICVRLAPTPNGHWATFCVRDTGIGIAPEMLPQVFHAFAQEHRVRERSHGGLGLGLALVKGLVEMHGGEVRARSDGLGRGSEFTVLLPRETAPEPARPAAAVPPPERALPRVLVVEDNRDAAETLRDLLEMLGHPVELAFNGPDALEKARIFRPEVVLCDLGLPGMDGCEVARRIRSDPAARSAVLAALTGYGQDEDRRRAREAGFDHFLVKPVDPAELEQLLGETGRESVRSSA